MVLANVTLTVPDVEAVNVRIAVPFCPMEPVSVSVAGPATVGAGVAVVVVSLLPHAAPNTLDMLNRPTASRARTARGLRVCEGEESMANM